MSNAIALRDFSMVSRIPEGTSGRGYVGCLLCRYLHLVGAFSKGLDDLGEYHEQMAATVLIYSGYCCRVACSLCEYAFRRCVRVMRTVAVRMIRNSVTHVANDAVAVILLLGEPPYTDVMDALSSATPEFKRRWARSSMNLPLVWTRSASPAREFMRQCRRALDWSPTSPHWRLAFKSRIFYSYTLVLFTRAMTTVCLLRGVEGCVWWSIPRELSWCIARHLYLFYCDEIVRI